MDIKQKRKEWNKFRYDYYVSGRVLNFNGLLDSSLLMLSYAIEVSMKFLISEYKNNKISSAYKPHRNKHNLNQLFDFMVNNDICERNICSDDFMSYITNNFLRYPKQIEESYDSFWSDIGSRMLDSALVTYFDDLFLRLDELICKKINSKNESILIKAIRDHDTYNGRAFFHQNFPAKLALENLFETEKAFSNRFKPIWDRDNFLIFTDLGYQEVHYSSLDKICEIRSAKNFRLPVGDQKVWSY